MERWPLHVAISQPTTFLFCGEYPAGPWSESVPVAEVCNERLELIRLTFTPLWGEGFKATDCSPHGVSHVASHSSIPVTSPDTPANWRNDWQFKMEDARIKLKSLYPKL